LNFIEAVSIDSAPPDLPLWFLNRTGLRADVRSIPRREFDSAVREDGCELDRSSRL
jgi:hypothetical protein